MRNRQFLGGALPGVFVGAFVGGSLLAQAGCLVVAGDEGMDAEEASEETGVSEAALSSSNRLSMNRLKAGSLEVVKLSTAPLSADGLTLAPTILLKSKAGRDVLTYLIRCALPAGQKVGGVSGGKVYSFSGLVGVAPTWLNQSLSLSGRRWMTACLLAHVNAYDEEVPISLRGNHPALSTTASESAQFTAEEMSFYGDLFTQGSGGMFACAGKGLQVKWPEDPDEYQAKRSCDYDDDCTIWVPGPCYDVTPSAMDSCEGGSVDWYSGCHPTAKPRGANWKAGDTSYTEVITVYMKPSHFAKFYGPGGLFDISIGIGIGIGLGL
jgi:hypothetical protein